MRAGAGLCLGLFLSGTLVLLHCGRQAAPAEAVQPLPRAPLEPWRWHFVGGLLVVEGELEEPTELVLTTRSYTQSLQLPLGPVRWEMYRPPRGEVAELRTKGGVLLATWDFEAPAAAEAPPRAAAPPAPPRPVPPPPPPPRPVPPPPPAPPKAVAPPSPLPPPAPKAVHPRPSGPPRPWAMTEPHLPIPAPRVAAPKVQVVPPPVPPPAPPKPLPPPPVPPPAPPKPLPPPPVPPPAPPKPLPPPPVPPPAPPKPLPSAPPAPSQPPPPPKATAPRKAKLPKPWAMTEPHLPIPNPWVAAPRSKPEPAPLPAPPPPAPPRPAPPAPVVPPAPKPAPPAPVVPPAPRPAPPAPVVPPAPRPAPPAPVVPSASRPAPPAPVVPSVPRPAPPAPVAPPAPRLVPPEPAASPAPLPPVPAGAAAAWPGAGEGLNLLRGPRGERRICMTFDGGSTAEVAKDVLDVLKEHGIRTTLFLTGDFIRKYPDLVRRMAQDGHELGNHTLTHPHMAPRMKRDPAWTRERMQLELLEADRALFQLLGRPMEPYWRAPYGEHTLELRRWAEEIGYRHVGWSEGADTLDWATVKERSLYRNGHAILDRLERRMEKQDGDGLIVLMHLGSLRPAQDRPALFLGPFIERALRDGWHFVTIGDYLKSMGKPRWDPAQRLILLGPGTAANESAPHAAP